jgi:hypothetical protein
MLFVVHWTIAPDHRDAAQARFKETGGMPPDGVKMIGRWHSAAGGEGLCVAETDDAVLLGLWTQDWSDLLSFEIIPVNDDEGVMKVLS